MSSRRTYIRHRHFEQAVQNYREGGHDIDGVEAWEACKGLLGEMLVPQMTELISTVYGHGEQYIAHQALTRSQSLRLIAKREARRIRARMALDAHQLADLPPFIPHNFAPIPIQPVAPAQAPAPQRQEQLDLPPPPPPPARPLPPAPQHWRLPLPQAPRHWRAVPPQLAPPLPRAPDIAPAAAQAHVVPSSFDAVRIMINMDGAFHGGVPDDMTPGQVAALFAAMEDRGECPICMRVFPKLQKWTYSCLHGACSGCMREFVLASLKGSTFPSRCPGGCGVPVDPRRVLDALATDKSIPESVLRFSSMQLAAVHVMDPTTCSEKCACPSCRTVICGRPSAQSPAARCTNPFCAARVCTRCQTPWHDGRDCSEMAKDAEMTDREVLKTSKPCPQCSRLAGHFRNHACHHLTCPCGYQYCYECLEPWSTHTVNGAKAGCRIFCSDACHCVECPDCKPGKPCQVCTGCDVCRTAIQL